MISTIYPLQEELKNTSLCLEKVQARRSSENDLDGWNTDNEIAEEAASFSSSSPDSRKDSAERNESVAPKAHQIGRADFEILKLLGKGGYGKVFLVRSVHDPSSLYAMKVLKKTEIGDPSKQMHLGNMVARTMKKFRNERNIMAELNHPNILKLKYAFQTKKKLFLVLEYCQGGELYFHLQQARFGERKARFYAANVLLALEEMHRNGLIYRDLKPENVLIGLDGYARMADFGLSKKLVKKDERCRSFCGTVEYLAPETIKGNGYTRSADWWAFGIFIFEMVTGQPPFLNENTSLLYKSILEEDAGVPKYLSLELQDLLKKLLEKDESKRLVDPEKIRNHPWFRTISWAEMLDKKLDPPFRPFSNGVNDTRNFDKEYTESPLSAEYDEEEEEEAEADPFWKGFSFCQTGL